MLLSKPRASIVVVLVLDFLASGATVLSCRTVAAQSEEPSSATDRPTTRQASGKKGSAPRARGQESDRPPAEQVKALMKEYQDSLDAFQKAVREVKGEAQRSGIDNRPQHLLRSHPLPPQQHPYLG